MPSLGGGGGFIGGSFKRGIDYLEEFDVSKLNNYCPAVSIYSCHQMEFYHFLSIFFFNTATTTSLQIIL